METPRTVQAWHALADTRDPAGLDALLHEDCVFRSPAVHAPQVGKELTTAYLSAALVVLGPTLAYQREWYAVMVRPVKGLHTLMEKMAAQLFG